MSGALFDAALRLVLSTSERRPHRRSARLDALFQTLSHAPCDLAAGEAEDLIWALWTSHDNAVSEERLDRAIRLIASRDLPGAQDVLDALLADEPHYVEAWNKRATLFFLAGDDERSIEDVARTLELEPRHFGAMCGFAQICLRHGRRAEALAVYDVALAVHPRLAEARSAVTRLSREFSPTAH
jgi:Tfp pilus assembly protein PilF